MNLNKTKMSKEDLTKEQIEERLRRSFEQIGEIVDFINDEERVKKAYESFQDHVKDYKVIECKPKQR
jgi:hypothetical protein